MFAQRYPLIQPATSGSYYYVLGFQTAATVHRERERPIGARSFTDLVDALDATSSSMTEVEACPYVRHCGYALTSLKIKLHQTRSEKFRWVSAL
jgi:hypothetical protein